jgi:hypothetical protein
MKIKKKCDCCKKKFNHVISFRGESLCRNCYRNKRGTLISDLRFPKEQPKTEILNLVLTKNKLEDFIKICKYYKMKKSVVMRFLVESFIEENVKVIYKRRKD